MKKQVVKRDGVTIGMSPAEKFITESQYEIKYGQPERALALVTKGLSLITDLDSLTFRSQTGLNLDQMERQGFLIRSSSLQQTGNLEEALAEVEKVVEEDPTSSKAILLKAEILYEMGLFEKALCQYYRGLRINPRFENNIFQDGLK